MAEQVYLGIDLGAESGRVMAGKWNGRKLALQELHRFPNVPVALADSLHWDVLRLWSEIQDGLALAGRDFAGKVVSVGADTWGVDFVLLGPHGEMLGQPCTYRDARTNGWMERAAELVPRERIFAHSGLQFMQINTLYQLLALRESRPELLASAKTLLLMPDFIHWALCGFAVVEHTNGTTTQFMDPRTRDWSRALLRQFKLPTKLLPPVVTPGTELGQLRESVAARTGLGNLRVVAPPTHDTAAAVAAVPTAHTGRPNWAYISSGTWSLMGVEVAEPILTPRTLELNFTNEGGVDGTFRLLRNIMGLWLVQQCKKSFERRGRTTTYAELAAAAAAAPALRSLVDPDDQRFFNPPDMPRAIQDYCKSTGQRVPKTEGELVRCAYESLAVKYREVLASLEELTGIPIEVIHIVGGGSQSAILNQFTADACQRPVITGPVEATVMGNVLTQARAAGEIGTLAELRAVVRRSSSLTTFEPASGSSEAWREAASRLAGFQREDRR